MTGEKMLRPIDPAWPEVRKLALIATALDNGRTWAEVASVLRAGSVGEAKKIRRELERKVRARQAAG